MNFILDNTSSSSSSSDDDEDDLIMNHFRLQQNIICRIISNNNIIISHLLDKQNRQDSSSDSDSDSDSECSSARKLGRRERGKAQMAAQTLCTNSPLSIPHNKNAPSISPHKSAGNAVSFPPQRARRKVSVQCSENQTQILRTCKNCKTQFDPLLNHPRACRFHSAHFGGETKRKFESVHSGGTMDTPDSGKVYQYWHCCGSEDAFDPGCTAVPHSSYDD